MSDTEVTVDVNKDDTWWRMEYKGHVDFLDYDPTAEDRREFRKMVDMNLRQSRVEKSIRANGHSTTVQEKPWN